MKKLINDLREWCGTSSSLNSKKIANNNGSARAFAALILGIAALAILFNFLTCGACSENGPLSCFTDCLCSSAGNLCQGCFSCYDCLYCG